MGSMAVKMPRARCITTILFELGLWWKLEVMLFRLHRGQVPSDLIPIPH